MLAVIKPTSPAFKVSTSRGFGVKTPTFSIIYSVSILIILFSYFFQISTFYSY